MFKFKSIIPKIKHEVRRVFIRQYYIVNLINFIFKPKKINIGSGRRSWIGWLCLDELIYPTVFNLKFTSTCIFPIKPNSFSLAYTSHCLEHLNDDVVNRLLEEVKKCLLPEGYFVVKIPDFDYFKEEYILGNSDAMNDKGVESVLWSWQNLGVEDNFENRTAMMFSGYWNKNYGDHFSGNINYSDLRAYHGPPLIEKYKLIKILRDLEIRDISKTLNSVILEDSNFSSFNHRNAWSKYDLEKLLIYHGFEIEKMDKKAIWNKFNNQIPDLESMYEWSMFVIAFKPK
jgi:predicted SAM-dependent methyltransferase